MQLQFLGAAGTVTGSCYFLTSKSDQSIFIYCGMFKGSEELEKFNFAEFNCDVSSAIGLVLTHAHLDHCGRLPRLVAQGFHAPMWMTEPTYDITEISLYDSAKIAEHEHNREGLYTKEQVEQTITLCKTVEYEHQYMIGDFQVVMRDAGHILGSASLEIVDTSAESSPSKIVFSGDLGNTPQDMIRPTERIANGNIVVMESTYGDREHPKENPSVIIQSEINAIEHSHGTLLIPAFSIERSQEILHRIAHLKRQQKIRTETPIFFDSPMGEKVTQVFEKYRTLFNPEFESDFAQGDPFHFPGLNIIQNKEESGEIDQTSGAKVIIAGSGMMTGGRILQHAARYLPEKSSAILIVGYQAEGTVGRQILDGKTTVTIAGQAVKVNGSVNQTQAMSSHADQPKLLSWLKDIQGVKKVFLLHGEDGPREVLASKIKADIGIADVVLPKMNEKVSCA